MNNESLVEK